ncbi:hypothetical protein BI308_23085 [Roseofilum reptotaenium AO1-A]|uniref:Uncharacterized protein n=1 Tax=Roseofilum reptotaenium AO1-A TaxID=1925591 RepID=A0A1L9QKJ4_9CYAN|nr:hypothetical protein BI308_23085 [Roseofilum reptotaenium AO1-A]
MTKYIANQTPTPIEKYQQLAREYKQHLAQMCRPGANFSSIQIAEFIRIADNSLASAIRYKQSLVRIRHQRNLTSRTKQAILSLHNQGVKPNRIAKCLGVSTSFVNQTIRNHDNT